METPETLKQAIKAAENILTTQNIHVSVPGIIINLLIAAAIAFILGRIYIRYGQSLSNRKLFARNFLLLIATTMLIITIVKSSLALSLGLVGALSIVRFRAAIKEPEELAYLFLAIGVGLGLGADQQVITIVAFAIISAMIVLKNFKKASYEDKNLHLIVTSHNPQKIPLEKILDILKKHCLAVDLKRFDETKELLEAAFVVEYADFSQLNQSKQELQNYSEHVKITFLDNQGLF
jgi:hypothetical protein